MGGLALFIFVAVVFKFIRYINFYNDKLPQCKSLLDSGVSRLQRMTAQGCLPAPLKVPVRQLAELGTHYSALYDGWKNNKDLQTPSPAPKETWSKTDLDLMYVVDAASRRIEGVLSCQTPDLWNSQADYALSSMIELSNRIRVRLLTAPSLSPEKRSAITSLQVFNPAMPAISVPQGQEALTHAAQSPLAIAAQAKPIAPPTEASAVWKTLQDSAPLKATQDAAIATVAQNSATVKATQNPAPAKVARPPAPVEPPRSAPPREDLQPSSPIEAFRDSAQRLEGKKGKLPPALRPHLKGIRETTESILECIRTDPEDVAPGTRFLVRYLPATHKVVDEHIRLSQEGGRYKNVQEALERSGALLARLEQAFIDEHCDLLRNDTMNFTAEIHVLDTLLKTQGK